MTWRIVSYSEIEVPLKPYKPCYVLAIIEDSKGERIMAQVEGGAKNISVGVEGDVKKVEGPNGEINLFTPKAKAEKQEVRKVALVTGSARGIGRAIAAELAKDGFDVVVNDVCEEGDVKEVLDEIKKLGRNAIYVKADVSELTQVDSMIEKTVSELGRLDVLVNNAGITADKMLANMTTEQWDKVIAVNLTGVFNCTKAAMGVMKQQGSGRIISISSIVGEIGNIGQANYSASKGGVISLTKTVARECASYGITVNAIAPGFIKTKMTEKIPQGVMKKILEQIPLGRMGEPREVARLVCYLASNDADYVTGQVFNINGGMYM